MKKITFLGLLLLVGLVANTGLAQVSCTRLTADLKYDTDHAEVRLLQRFLNGSGYRIAESGAGSPGQETTTFWDGTRTQVIKFQRDNGISPTGIVGPTTRAKIAELSCNTRTATEDKSVTIESLLALIAQLRAQLDALIAGKSTTDVTGAEDDTETESTESDTASESNTLTVLSPSEGAVLSNKSGNPIAKILWAYDNLTARITVELHNEDGLVRTLQTRVANSGRYTWDYSSTLKDGDYTLVVKAYSSSGTLLETAETGYFEVSKTKEAVAGEVKSTTQSTSAFVAAPIVRNSAGVPIVTSTYDLNANPFHRLIPATGGTRSVAIAFPVTRGGTLMMTPGINEYVRPDRTEVNISTKPYDFAPMQSACNQVNEISSDISLQWVTRQSDMPSWGACLLEANKIYYFNIRYVKADGTTACSEDTCGAYMDLPPFETIVSALPVAKPSELAVAQTVDKSYDLTDGTSRATVQLSGTQVASVAFNSWRSYSTETHTHTGGNMSLGQASDTGLAWPSRTELNISETPGDFTAMSSECTNVKGDDGRVAMSMQWTTDPASKQVGDGVCLLEPNTKYYANIRFVDKTGTTSSCRQETCARHLNLSYNTPKTVTSTTPSSGGKSCTALTADLELGDDNVSVKKLQEFLNSKGYTIATSGAGSPGNETTYFGDKTRLAVIAFQTHYGISQTGVAGPVTRAKVRELSCGGVSAGTSQPEVVFNPITTSSATLSILSPKTGDVLSNSGNCPEEDTSADVGPSACIKAPIVKIFWSYKNVTAKITIEVYNDNGLVKTLGTRMPNSGRYTWAYSPALSDGDYKIVITATSLSGATLATGETGYFTVSKTGVASSGGGGGVEVSKTLSFSDNTPRFKSTGVPGETISYGFDFKSPYDAGLVTLVETSDFGTDAAKYTAWISKTPGGSAVSPKVEWQYTGGAIHFEIPPGFWWSQTKIEHGKYYFNVTRKTKDGDGSTATENSQYWAQVNMSKVGIGAGSATADKDINGNTIPSPTGPAGSVMCEGMNANTKTPGSGPGPCGSYEIPVSSGENCSSGMTGENRITKAWQYNLEDGLYLRKGNSMRLSLKRDHAMVFRFKTDTLGSYPFMPYPLQFGYDEHTANGPAFTKFMSLSEDKCDFDYSKLATYSLAANGSVVPDTITESINNCFQAQTFAGALLGRITATQSETMAGNLTKNFPYCQLKPDTYYYLNIRWEQAVNNPRAPESPSRGIISCPEGMNSRDVCGMVIVAN
jgi:peptidoglycan hydrolase-like protein with peptidoglycan-binding domain